MSRQSAPRLPVGTIASATALGGGIVKAVHYAGEQAIRVRCTRCDTLLTDTYRADAPHAEIRACCSIATIRVQAHASTCTAKPLRNRGRATAGSGAKR